MKKINFSDSKVSKVLSGKGFYIALCCSLIAVGVAGYAAYNQTVNELSKTPSISIPDKSSQTDWDFNAVNKIQSDISKDDSSDLEVETAAQPMILPLNGEVQNPFRNNFV